LDYLGIISRSEIFELCGKFILNINGVRCDFGGFYRGVCINSQAEKDIEFFDLSGINSILFIENKTNYEE
jgi:hypothetical protein